MMHHRTKSRVFIALGLAAAWTIPQPAAAVDGVLGIEVLSNRADLVSGGDALVELRLPVGVQPSAVTVGLNGSDVTDAFALRQNGRFQGVVTGLEVGANVLAAAAPDLDPVALTITNHPTGGPVFSGPQVEPWLCETELSGLEPAIDEQCNALVKHELLYKAGDEFLAYNPSSPPSDLETTTTDAGQSVPYIVLRETGTINRAVYQFAVLVDPTTESQPWAPGPFNGKLLYGFGGGAGCEYRQGILGYEVLYDRALSKGFAVATASLNRLVQNCNIAVSAETVMMVKEMVADRFGAIRYTIGTGSSGGGLQQQVIAGAYPGLLNAISPGASFMDVLTTAVEVADCSLVNRVFNVTSPHLWGNVAQRAAVMGHQTTAPCEYWTTIGRYDHELINPRLGCGPVPTDRLYHPTLNRSGLRCTAQDYLRSVFGFRDDGFANSPHDNVGIQYGLSALERGLITTEQFVDLNARIGGYDIDMGWTPQRTVADDEALSAAYRAGVVNTGREMAKVPVIDRRSPPVNHDIHASFRTWAMRARLVKQNGHHDNQVIWIQGTESRAFDTNEQWLRAIEADPSDDSLEVKVLRHKPGNAVDGCWAQSQRVDLETCKPAFPHYADPRIAAGAPFSDDILKCQTSALDREAYRLRVEGEPVAPIVFTDLQWTRLQAAFPGGVCDWAEPGVGEQATIPWLSFAGASGGAPIGDPPAARPFAWEQCEDGQVRTDATPAGVGVRVGGTPPSATRVIICSNGALPFHGAVIVRVDPQAPNAYVDITGDESSTVPCTQGFWRARFEQPGPRFWSGDRGSYEDTDPDTPGNQPPTSQSPDAWAQSMAAKCTG